MLYRVASVVIYGGPEDPRYSLNVRLCSDRVVLAGKTILTERGPILRPTAAPPREWLLEALEGIPRR